MIPLSLPSIKTSKCGIKYQYITNCKPVIDCAKTGTCMFFKDSANDKKQQAISYICWFNLVCW